MTTPVPHVFLFTAFSLAHAGCVIGVSLGATDGGGDSGQKLSRPDARADGAADVTAPRTDAITSQCKGGGSFGNGGGECEADESMFNFVVATCAADHEVVAAFTPDEHCGSGSSLGATYSCCSAVPAGSSMGEVQNAQGICDSDTSFFTSAEATCTGSHQSLVAFVPNESCGDASSSGATYTCAP